MHARGVDLWPATLCADLVEGTHYGWRLRCDPDRLRNLTDVLDRPADRFPDREAVVTPSERVTWQEFRVLARPLTAGLHACHGLKPGDRVGVLLLMEPGHRAIPMAKSSRAH
jgi:non-ribosomal peptide synthetase component E (peptide arylation enzyme)